MHHAKIPEECTLKHCSLSSGESISHFERMVTSIVPRRATHVFCVSYSPKAPVRSIKQQVQMFRVEYEVYYGWDLRQKFIETSDNMPYESCLVPPLWVHTEEEEGHMSLSAVRQNSKSRWSTSVKVDDCGVIGLTQATDNDYCFTSVAQKLRLMGPAHKVPCFCHKRETDHSPKRRFSLAKNEMMSNIRLS
jgi:hypothetical protein